MQKAEANEALVAILKKSHEQAMNGEAIKMEKIERSIKSCPDDVQMSDKVIKEEINAIKEEQ